MRYIRYSGNGSVFFSSVIAHTGVSYYIAMNKLASSGQIGGGPRDRITNPPPARMNTVFRWLDAADICPL
jgi:hypothetical protein